MTPSEIGERAEIAVMAALANAGQRVLVPFGGHHRYDLAFEHQGALVRVQCKTGRPYKGVVVFSTSDHTVGGLRDYRGQADLFGVYCPERDDVYLVPVEDVPRRAAHLRLEPPRTIRTTASGWQTSTWFGMAASRMPWFSGSRGRAAVRSALGAAVHLGSPPP